MTAIRTSKWTAFLLSACVPGAGQLAARSWTCVGWFLAAGMLAAALSQMSGPWLFPLQFVAGIALCLVSAEHAKRLMESRSDSANGVVRASVCKSHSRGRQIDIAISLDVPRSQEELWKQISDLPHFLTIDPFHDQVTLMRDMPAVGVDLVLSHNAFGWRFLRFGRIIAWREGSGYTFSDLSPRGSKQGFPHVFMIDLQPVATASENRTTTRLLTRLSIRVRGRWTSSISPGWVGRLWVWLVCREHARLLRKGI